MRLFIFVIILYFIQTQASFLIRSSFNPIKPDNISFNELIFGQANRCYLYPRCLLFQCCSSPLLQAVDRYHYNHNDSENTNSPNNSSSLPIEIHPCLQSYHYFIDTPYCKHIHTHKNHTYERISTHPWVNLTITTDLLTKTIYYLPPTPIWMYTHLKARNIKHFKVLYLIQGEHRSLLPSWYSIITEYNDVIFLSYKQPQSYTATDTNTSNASYNIAYNPYYINHTQFNLYYPNSTFSQGRTALYAAGRLLELQQGWLYDYMIFLDDDITLHSDYNSPQAFVSDLMQWRPALAGPSLHAKYPPVNTTVASVGHIDYIYIAYHREALEALYPLSTEQEDVCVWASQLRQLYEASLVYRNHILAFASMRVGNRLHRAYPRHCFESTGFPAVLVSLIEAVPEYMRHCLPPSFRNFPQGVLLGKPHIKLNSYHLLTHHNHNYDPQTRLVNSSHLSYMNLTQSVEYKARCGSQWNASNEYCCTVNGLVNV